MTFCMFTRLKSVSSIIRRNMRFIFTGERLFASPNKTPNLSSAHHFLPLTEQVNARNTELKLGFSELLTFGACPLQLMLPHKAEEVSLVYRDYPNVKNSVCKNHKAIRLGSTVKGWRDFLFEVSLSTHKAKERATVS